MRISNIYSILRIYYKICISIKYAIILLYRQIMLLQVINIIPRSNSLGNNTLMLFYFLYGDIVFDVRLISDIYVSELYCYPKVMSYSWWMIVILIRSILDTLLTAMLSAYVAFFDISFTYNSNEISKKRL